MSQHMKPSVGYEVFDVNVAEIYLDDDFNCRQHIPLHTVTNLAGSIKRSRLESPVILQPAKDVLGGLPLGCQWRIVAGHRRFVACTRILKWETIPAIIRYGLSEQAAHLLNFIENLDRRDLNLYEEALALKHTFPSASIPEMQAHLHRGTQWILTRLEILKLPENVQQAIAAGTITAWDITMYRHQKRPADFFEILKAQKEAGLTSYALYCGTYKKGRGRRPRKEVQDMMVEILTSGGYSVSASRALAWATNSISTEEFRADILDSVSKGNSS